MTQLADTYAFTITGDPIYGNHVPELRGEGAPLNDLQVADARAVYNRFVGDFRVSLLPFQVQMGALSDGSPYRIVAMRGHRIMQVWPIDDAPLDQVSCGIVITTSAIQDGKNVRWLLTHSGAFATPLGDWAVRKPWRQETTLMTWYDGSSHRYLGTYYYEQGFITATEYSDSTHAGFITVPSYTSPANVASCPRYYVADDQKYLLAFYADFATWSGPAGSFSMRSSPVVVRAWALSSFETGASVALPLSGLPSTTEISIPLTKPDPSAYGGYWAVHVNPVQPVVSIAVTWRTEVYDSQAPYNILSIGFRKLGVVFQTYHFPTAYFVGVDAGGSVNHVQTTEMNQLSPATSISLIGERGWCVPSTVRVYGLNTANPTIQDYYMYQAHVPEVIYDFVSTTTPPAGTPIPLGRDVLIFHEEGERYLKVARSAVHDTRYELRYRADGTGAVVRRGGNYSETHQFVSTGSGSSRGNTVTYTISGGQYFDHTTIAESSYSGGTESEYIDEVWEEYPGFGRIYTTKDRTWQKSDGTYTRTVNTYIPRNDTEYSGSTTFTASCERRLIHLYDPTLDLLCYSEIVFDLSGDAARYYTQRSADPLDNDYDMRDDDIHIPFTTPTVRLIICAGTHSQQYSRPAYQAASAEYGSLIMAPFRVRLQFNAGFLPWDYDAFGAPEPPVTSSIQAFSMAVAVAPHKAFEASSSLVNSDDYGPSGLLSYAACADSDFGIFDRYPGNVGSGVTMALSRNPRSGAGLLRFSFDGEKHCLLIDRSGIKELSSALPDVPYDTIIDVAMQ